MSAKESIKSMLKQKEASANDQTIPDPRSTSRCGGQSKWRKAVVLLAALIGYMFAGAMMFRLFERRPAVMAAERFQTAVRHFVDSNDCLGESCVEELMNIVTRAIGQGAFSADAALAVSLNRGVSNESFIQQLWTIENSFFFSSTVITTIGFGNLAPRTGLGQTVCVIYALFGIPLTAGLLLTIGDSLSSCWKCYMKSIGKMTKCLKSRRAKNVIAIVIFSLLSYTLLAILPMVILYFTERWNFIESHYFAVITLTTVGLGDLVAGTNDEFSLAESWSMKVVIILYFFIGLSAIAMMLQGVLKQEKRAANRFKSSVQRLVSVQRMATKWRDKAKDASPDDKNDVKTENEKLQPSALLKRLRALQDEGGEQTANSDTSTPDRQGHGIDVESSKVMPLKESDLLNPSPEQSGLLSGEDSDQKKKAERENEENETTQEQNE